MNRAVIALLCLGLCQMVADVAGLNMLKALAGATGASPAPKVFTRYGGLEPFSMQFAIELTDQHGRHRRIALTPERYAQLRGPYNRRNTYGAAIAAGPAMQANHRTRAMLGSVLRYGVCGDAPVLRELGVDPTAITGPITLHYAARENANTEDLPLSIEVPCS